VQVHRSAHTCSNEIYSQRWQRRRLVGTRDDLPRYCSVRFGSQLPVSGDELRDERCQAVSNVDRVLGNNSTKTVVINSLEAAGALGSPYV